MKKRALSLLVSFSLVVACLYGAFVPANVSAESGGRDYVIFDAEPSSVSSEDMASAKPVWASDTDGHFWAFGYKATGTGVIRTDEEVPYYSCNLTEQGGKGGAILENGLNYFDSAGYLGWMSYRSVIDALKQYIVVSYEIRVNGLPEAAEIRIGPVPEWSTGDPYEVYGEFDSVSISDTAEWQAISEYGAAVIRQSENESGDPHWSCGDLSVSVQGGAIGEAPVTVDLRRFRLELRESDRAAVNAALSSVEGIDSLKWFTGNWEGTPQNNLPKDENGNTDYFQMLVKYDAAAAYAEGYPLIKSKDSSPHGELYAPENAKPGETVVVAAVPHIGYNSAGVSAVSAEGGEISVSETDGGWSFVMPEASVTLTAEFVSEASEAESRLTVWEALPESISVNDGASASVAWGGGNEFITSLTGTAAVKTDEIIPYYRASIASSDISAGAAFGGSEELAGSILGDPALFAAVAPYLHIEGETRIEPGPNMTLKPAVRLYPLSASTSGAPGWEIGAFTYFDEWKSGYELCRWVGFDIKGVSLSSNKNKLFWNGDLYLQISYDASDITSPADQSSEKPVPSEPVIVDLRNIRLTVDEADKAAIDAALAAAGVENGFERLTEFDRQSSFTVRGDTGDINGDGGTDVKDLVRLEKLLSGSVPGAVYTAADLNGDGEITSVDMVLLTKLLYGELIVYPVAEHPGVVNMDAEYDFTVYSDGLLEDGEFTLTASDSRVKILGSQVTVPYAVRASEDGLTVTAVSSDGKKGYYSFNFTKMSSEPSFTENFDDHTDGWVYSSESSAGTVADGKLTFSVEEEGPQKFCLYTERFRQAYGCFSAAMKMPEIGTANASFFMTGEKFNENPYVPYNSFGEIDVVEYYSTWGENWAGTVHWYLWNPDMYRSSGDEELYGNNIRNGYHTYSVVWTEDAIYWYYDYELRRIYDGPGVTSGSGPMKLLLQLRPDYEDGWGGEYDPSAYPYEMCVDWVNAWSIVS